MAFDTFDLGRIIATSEGVKAQRRQSQTDMLREQLLGQQMQQGQTTFQQGQEDRQYQIDQRTAKEKYLEAHALELSQDPIADAQQFAPDLVKSYETKNGAGSFAQADPNQVKQLATQMKSMMAAKAGIQVPAQMRTIQGDNGAILQQDPTTGALKQVVAPQRPQKEDHFAAEQAAADRRANEARAFQAEQGDLARRDRAEQSRLDREGRAALKGPNSQQAVAERQRTASVYLEARNGLLSGLGDSVTGPVLGRAPAMTAKQQIAEGGVSAMAPVLKQLFRSAGEGTFTDKDQELLLRMVPTRADEPEARKAKIGNIDRIISAKLGVEIPSWEQGKSAAPSSKWSVVEVK